jgi:hypothetical protein
MAIIVIAAEGPSAAEASAMAAKFFKEEFGAEARIEAAAPGDEKVFEHIDPNWICAVLSIPPAVLASIELNQRLKLIERVEGLLAALRQKLGRAGGVIRVGAAKSFDIAAAKAKDIADAILSEGGKER